PRSLRCRPSLRLGLRLPARLAGALIPAMLAPSIELPLPESHLLPSMEKRSVFGNKLLPYMLLVPQLAITLVFFYWPASQAAWTSFRLEDAFGTSSDFVGFENYQIL